MLLTFTWINVKNEDINYLYKSILKSCHRVFPIIWVFCQEFTSINQSFCLQFQGTWWRFLFQCLPFQFSQRVFWHRGFIRWTFYPALQDSALPFSSDYQCECCPVDWCPYWTICRRYHSHRMALRVVYQP